MGLYHNIEGFVLTGGASARMGRDKATLSIRNKSFVENAAETLSTICSRIYTVGGTATIAGVEHLDDVPHPLSIGKKAAINGLHTALSNCATRYAMVLACDMPFVTSEFIALLAEQCEKLAGSGTNAVIPVDSDGRSQPLCAIYAAEPCLEEMRNLPGVQVPRVDEFVNLLRPLFVNVKDLPEFNGNRSLLMNINTPEDLERAVGASET